MTEFNKAEWKWCILFQIELNGHDVLSLPDVAQILAFPNHGDPVASFGRLAARIKLSLRFFAKATCIC